MSLYCDVLVVGGGPVGLLSGYLLRRYYNVHVILIEKALKREGYSRAFGVTPRTMEIFDSIDGLGDQIRSVASKVNSFCHIFPKKTHVWEDFFAGVSDMRESVLMLAQSSQEEICRERFINAGGDYRRGIEYVSLKQEEGSVVTIGSDTVEGRPVEIRSKYVIGADGAHSAVRKSLGVTFDGYTDKSVLWLADVTKPEGTHGLFRVFHTANGPCMELPIGDQISRLICGWADSESCPYDSNKQPTPELFAGEVKRRGGGDYTTANFLWCNRLTLNFRIASHYYVGNVFLAGDAAHVHSPAGGQGLNTGYQDAVNLVWKLGSVLKYKMSTSVLETYHRERAPVAQDTLKMTARSRSIFNTKSPFQVMVMSCLLGVLRPCWWPLRLKFVRSLYQATLRPQDAFGGWEMWRGRDSQWSRCHTPVGCRFPNLLVLKGNHEKEWLSTTKPFDHGMWIYIDGVGQESTDDQSFHQVVCNMKAPEPFQSIPTAFLRITFCEWTEAFLKHVKSHRAQSVVVPCDILLARELCVGNESSALYYIRPDGLVAMRSRPASVYLGRFRSY